jgi:serine-type D-Ala-D-Ala carboxypeptidase (penicillin-binding protein 5/6)
MQRSLSFIAVALGFFILGFSPPALIDAAEHSVPLYPSHMPFIQQAQPPQVGAEAFAIVDGSTGQLLAGQDAHQRLPPASTTKIATAIVALEYGRLDDKVLINVDSRAMIDSSVMGIVPGEILTLHDLLYGLMLPSGNDAALAIARHVGHSEQQFAEMMNAKVRELGLANTNFVNPHGLDDPDHYSSPYDLAALARHAMANPTFAAIVSTPEYTVRGEFVYHMYNTNHLLSHYADADGVKTGYTESAMQTLVASATRDGRQMFVTVMRSSDRIGDSKPLLDYAFANYGWRSLDLSRNAINSIGGLDGRGRQLAPRPVEEICLPSWQLPFVRPSIWLDDGIVDAQADDDARQGFAGFYLGQRLLAEVPIYGR